MGSIGEGADHGVHTDPRPPVNIALPARVPAGEVGEDGLASVHQEEETEQGGAQPDWRCHHWTTELTVRTLTTSASEK